MSRAIWMSLDAEDIPNNTKHKSKISLASHHHLISPCDYVLQSSHQTIQGFVILCVLDQAPAPSNLDFH
jgi:hypothetical protein